MPSSRKKVLFVLHLFVWLPLTSWPSTSVGVIWREIHSRTAYLPCERCHLNTTVLVFINTLNLIVRCWPSWLIVTSGLVLVIIFLQKSMYHIQTIASLCHQRHPQGGQVLVQTLTLLMLEHTDCFLHGVAGSCDWLEFGSQLDIATAGGMTGSAECPKDKVHCIRGVMEYAEVRLMLPTLFHPKGGWGWQRTHTYSSLYFTLPYHNQRSRLFEYWWVQVVTFPWHNHRGGLLSTQEYSRSYITFPFHNHRCRLAANLRVQPVICYQNWLAVAYWGVQYLPLAKPYAWRWLSTQEYNRSLGQCTFCYTFHIFNSY